MPDGAVSAEFSGKKVRKDVQAHCPPSRSNQAWSIDVMAERGDDRA